MTIYDSRNLELLAELFDSYVSQDPLEDAVDLMVGLSSADSVRHKNYLDALNEGVRCALASNKSVIDLINASGGYKANTFEDAFDLLSRFRQIYLEKYALEKAKSRG